MRPGPAIAIALLSSGVAHARGTCTIETKKAAPLTVQVVPKEASPFSLRVQGVPLAIEPGGLETPATVRVRGALAFEAQLGNDAIPARLKRAVEDLSGMVRLAQATEKLTLHANVRSRLVDASVKLPGVELRGLTLPCDALTLDDVAEPKPMLEDMGEARFVAKGATLHFRSGPGKGAAIEAAVDDSGSLELRRIEEESGWMRVTTRWPDGTTLTGWVKRDELVEAGMHHERVGDVLRPPGAGEPACEPPRVGENERLVAAPVAVGTEVYAARYLGPWAKVADGSKLQLRVRPKDDWVEIVTVPGIACTLDAGWIPRAAAKLPPDPGPAAAAAPVVAPGK